MKITPTQSFVLVRMKDIDPPAIELPEGFQLEPYGVVVEVGPDCKFVKTGDNVKFLPANMVCGFDEHGDPRFIIGEGAIFATIDNDLNQDGSSAPDLTVTKPTIVTP